MLDAWTSSSAAGDQYAFSKLHMAGVPNYYSLYMIILAVRDSSFQIL